MPSLANLNKLFPKYRDRFGISKAKFLREAKSPGVSLHEKYIKFKYNEIISRFNQEGLSFSIVSKNVKVVVFYEHENYFLYTSDTIFPHTGRTLSYNSYEKKLKLRHLCLGDNVDHTDYLIKDFKLAECRFVIEDIMSTISYGGYWFPERKEYKENMTYESCRFCTGCIIKKGDLKTCDNCRANIKRNSKLRKMDLDLIKLCRACGKLFPKEEKCKHGH